MHCQRHAKVGVFSKKSRRFILGCSIRALSEASTFDASLGKYLNYFLRGSLNRSFSRTVHSQTSACYLSSKPIHCEGSGGVLGLGQLVNRLCCALSRAVLSLHGDCLDRRTQALAMHRNAYRYHFLLIILSTCSEVQLHRFELPVSRLHCLPWACITMGMTLLLCPAGS